MILHILNGDAMLTDFQETGIEGAILVWREALSEGPLMVDICGLEFWQMRSEWIVKAYNETLDNYNGHMINELTKLNNIYSELVLWFEFDLFCQANLLGTLAYIRCQPHLQNAQISLICPDSFPGMANFRGLGELNASQLASLYPDRKTLSATDLETANGAWQAFTKKDPFVLWDWLVNAHISDNLPSLRQAMMVKVKTLTKNEAGLDYVEQKLLDIYQSGARSFADIYREFSQAEPLFGLGDAQVLTYLKNLRAKGFKINISESGNISF